MKAELGVTEVSNLKVKKVLNRSFNKNETHGWVFLENLGNSRINYHTCNLGKVSR